MGAIWAPAASAADPVVTIDPNPTVGLTTAHVTGSVDPGTQEVEVYLEYRRAGESVGYTEIFLETLPANSGPTPISGDISGLLPGKSYEVRLDAFFSGQLFLSEEPNPVFTTEGSAPSASIEQPSLVSGHTAVFTGHVNPNAVEPEASTSPEEKVVFETEWEFRCEPACPGLKGKLAADNTSHEVTATATGLVPATTYEVTLVAGNRVGNTVSEQKTFVTLSAAPEIRGTVASDLAPTAATLRTAVNPGAASTTYRFQYVTEQQFEASGFALPRETPEATLPPGTVDVPIQARIESLTPGTRYRFRAVASNVVAPVDGPAASFETPVVPTESQSGLCQNEIFRSGPSALLPDCRAYEQVTEVNKNGGDVGGRADIVKAAPAGSAVTFFTQAGVPGGRGAQDFPTFLASRGDSSWSTQGLLPPQELGKEAIVLGYTPDLRFAVTSVRKPGSGTGLFLEDTLTREISPIVPYRSDAPEASLFAFDGASENGRVVFFESTVVLAPGAVAEKQNLYVWDAESRTVKLVGRLPNGEPAAAGSFGGAYDWFTPNLTRGGAFRHFYVAEAHAISPDGALVYFTTGETGQLYLRRNPSAATEDCSNPAAACTINVSAPNAGVVDPNGEQPAAFLSATSNGRQVFFMSSGKLTADATTGPADEGRDLYRYDTATGELTDITPDGSDPAGAEVQGIVGLSTTGSSAYFVANGVLGDGAEEGAEPGNCISEAEGGTSDNTPRACNLYHFQASGGGSVTFVARLDGTARFAGMGSNDTRDWSPVSFDPALTIPKPKGRTARVSADGQTVVFASVHRLTGYDNAAPGCNSVPGVGADEPCHEYFRYSASTGALDCISCNPAGAAAVGPATMYTPRFNVYIEPIGVRGAVETRNLSASGNRIFFQTPDALVPGDTNGASGCTFVEGEGEQTGSCQDVYEWEALGTGSCQIASVNGGCLYLISTGQGGQPSYFGDADAQGENVFVFTRSQLVPVDQDQLFDLYDARVQGGLSSQHESPPASCVGEACQGGPTPVPGEAPPGSASVNGPGNAKKNHHHAKKCKKRSGKKGKNCKAPKHKQTRHKQTRHGKKHGKSGRTTNKSDGGAK
ncbi:MAG: hypothetical protein ACRDPE_11340 [Solirubrobacterales bacterium]